MKSSMFQVPLSKLYKVVASCNYNEDNLFCPVLVKIINEKIRTINKGHTYLLQVWNRTGNMIFEKSLRNPISNWNISGDKFVF